MRDQQYKLSRRWTDFYRSWGRAAERRQQHAL